MGNDQNASGFWETITDNYNMYGKDFQMWETIHIKS